MQDFDRPIRIDLHIHGETNEVEILQKLNFILERLNFMAHTLDETLAAVTDESTQIDSLIAFTDGLKKQIADALSGVTLPAAVQDKVDAVFAGVVQNKTKVVAAFNENVTPAV